MAAQLPNLDLPPVSDKNYFPLVVAGVVLVLAMISAWWFLPGHAQHQGHATAVTALEEQLNKDRAVLDAERAKSVEMTQQLEAMKQAYALGKVPDQRQAIGDYAKLSTEHEAQRKKVKDLTDQYNEKIANLRKLQ